MSEIGKPDEERNSYGETSCLIDLVNCLSGLAGGRFFWRGQLVLLLFMIHQVS